MQPWYKIVTPREDLREGKPLDASEFAVNLDHVRGGTAKSVYQNPSEFFDRTFLTKDLRDLASQTIRRLNGIEVETSAVFNLSTQFGGGKTHALTLLYHLAKGKEEAHKWKGVNTILNSANVDRIPEAATAIFVGTEFDSVSGRGGQDGTPKRQTPWGEIAFQLGGTESYELVAEHDQRKTAPAGDVIKRMLGKNKPTLILLDELMNYISRHRRDGLTSQLYNFLHNLSEASRAQENVVLVVSIPASEREMTAEDFDDFDRFKKLLDRLGKPMIMSAETETSEIIRRRLFEWQGLDNEAIKVIKKYENWFQNNHQHLPGWFPVDSIRDVLKASYPFHPSLLSVFERKWQRLQRFQRTRGVLRLLALWVSKAYSDGYKGAHKDLLISLGTAPLEDPQFRAAVFEQLGDEILEPAVTTDIVGHEHAHAVRLDDEASTAVKKARLHRKIATAVFFESNGGQRREEATLPEIRLAVTEPGLDIGNVEQCLESLTETCYFLLAERNRYRFSSSPNLNKLLSDRRASISEVAIEEQIRKEIQTVFSAGPGIERVYFPERSSQIPDRTALTIVVLTSAQGAHDLTTIKFMENMTQESGSSFRIFKSALIWAVAEDRVALASEARKYLAWQDIQDEAEDLQLDEGQRRQLPENVERAARDLHETVWSSYNNIFLLHEDNSLQPRDLGLIHSSAAKSLVDLIISRLIQDDIVVESVNPRFLVRYWPSGQTEWSTKAIRDAFYASPKFPRLLKSEAIKETIARGQADGAFAYGASSTDGGYDPFVFKGSLRHEDIEITEDTYLIRREHAEEYLHGESSSRPIIIDKNGDTVTTTPSFTLSGGEDTPGTSETSFDSEIESFIWTGDITHQNWMNFYTKVLSHFATSNGLKLRLTAEVAPPQGITQSKVEEVRNALRTLGMNEEMKIKKRT